MFLKILLCFLLFVTIDVDAKSFVTLPNVINEVGKKINNDETMSNRLMNKYNFRIENGNLYNDITGLLATKVKKVIDISTYQKNIAFDLVKDEVYGVIVRIGYGSNKLDDKFEQYISEIKKYNIPYGIYLYSYAENTSEALNEAAFTYEIIKKYNLNPTLGVYYDIESFYVNGEKVVITTKEYEGIIKNYINYLKTQKIKKVGVYTNTKLYKRKFNDKTKKYVTWIAQYYTYFYYQKNIKMWQYTEKGKINGIDGFVDINVLFE